MDIAEIRKKAKNRGQGSGVRGQGSKNSGQGSGVSGQVKKPTPEPQPPTPELVIPTELEYRRSLGYKEVDANLFQVVTFVLGPEEYAMDVAEVREVIKMREITDVPHTPFFIIGIISLRGEVVPILDLRKRLGLTPSGLAHSARIVVVHSPSGPMGLVVDRVTGLTRIDPERIEPAPPVKGEIDIEFIKGVAHSNGRLLILLNLQKVVEI